MLGERFGLLEHLFLSLPKLFDLGAKYRIKRDRPLCLLYQIGDCRVVCLGLIRPPFIGTFELHT